MKTIILAGGFGTRLAEETELRPKPMVEIGDKPILWHIMRSYASHGFREFVVALGYKGEYIKRFFWDYYNLSRDLTVDLGTGRVEQRGGIAEDWKVHLCNTGLNTMTGGRIWRVRDLVRGERFMLTYGDGVTDANIADIVEFHKRHGKIATVLAVRPPSRFGGLEFDGDLVSNFIEKPQIGEGWINGGFMVFEPAVLEYLVDDTTKLEQDVLETLAAKRQLAAYRHTGFWQCMDTLRDKHVLEQLWREGRAPWMP
ncbi:MAG: glucose-1-phosphate cytidylyltransferase [Deltaproteobacteria bacterium]|nr:glucose-1-phosphate cytidylyltransferase [Deltaproteobacteria bacterium]